MTSSNQTKYIEALGRRKAAIARVRLYSGGTGLIKVNDRLLKEYLPVEIMQQSVVSPLRETGMENVFDITVHVTGGGIHGQADSIRLGIARALIDFNPEFRSSLKKVGFLTRDARIKERKKYGKKSARRSPQWSKR
ncbi:MAG: 30S ribosomal protein S9 [Candidatus Uhrbacteria bacterium GW2011_GWF2_39_13]|uniref:Small ribosomal subunit protein uS9 n=1 Tax=Candidatus Uhrbacteria bacterium GW2011_GWF2_39_13 TaxID=1618995 RepID=A0A0G0QTE6_9BACT|nr:MAG: 30S ribosomal protein S9 [Candidatus Uhrbacteria bacterium GW2011_GWF2_39_13]HAU66096.1 30S ribosomal protein S9 [Candidatus Uhrbacteria bacterium]